MAGVHSLVDEGDRLSDLATGDGLPLVKKRT
jgi:hypothetical protein